MPQKGRPSRNRYRNTSDLSNGVQRANASGNVPPTKFEAARSRFFVGRDGVSHPRNAEMRFSYSSKSVCLPLCTVAPCSIKAYACCYENCYACGTNKLPNSSRCTYRRWTCESVSGSHLRERSDEGGTPQRRYDPSDDRDGTAGVPSTQPVLVREPTSAFSVRWGGSYCPLCSTPRSRGRERPED